MGEMFISVRLYDIGLIFLPPLDVYLFTYLTENHEILAFQISLFWIFITLCLNKR